MQGADSVLMYQMIESFIENDIEGEGKSKYAPERDIDTVQTGGDAYREIMYNGWLAKQKAKEVNE